MNNGNPLDLSEYPAMMTPAHVGEVFGVDPKTVLRWSDKGWLVSIRTPGGHRRYPKLYVQRALFAHLSGLSFSEAAIIAVEGVAVEPLSITAGAPEQLQHGERLRQAVTRDDLADQPHTITVEHITDNLRTYGELPADAKQVILERHHGRIAKWCGTDQDLPDPAWTNEPITIEQAARNLAHTYGATYVPAAGA